MSVDDFIKEMAKAHGAGSVIKYGDDNPAVRADVVSTGSINLDIKTGIGGFPRGRISVVSGAASSGKTTICLHAIAEAQKQDLSVLFVDAEHALDPFYAEALGVNLKELLISQPDSGEEALDIVERGVRGNFFSLVVVDSVAALTPKRELEGEMGDVSIGLLARLMSQATRKLSGITKKNNVALVFINQYRSNINTTGYGSSGKVNPGGVALQYASSLILDVARIKTLTDKDGEAGAHRTRVKITKNKFYRPYQEAEFDIVFGKGINRTGEIIDLSVDLGLISKTGAWYKYGESLSAQGREKMTEQLNDNIEIREELYEQIKNRCYPRDDGSS